MQFAALLSKVTCALLGERDLHASANAVVPEKGGTYFSSGHGAGYLVQTDESGVTIRHHSRWAALAGLPSLYWFKGIISRSDNEMTLDGRVFMTQPAKGFILMWIGAVSVALAIGIVLAIIKAAEFMSMTTPLVGDGLSTAGFLIGAVMILAVFGALVIGALRAVKRSERDGLIRFCESFGMGDSDKVPGSN